MPISVFRTPPNLKAELRHVFIIDISPLASTIDHINSGKWPPEREILGHFMHLIALHLGRDFNPRDWRRWFNGSVKQVNPSLDWGIHTEANAMAIAFGYTLNNAGRNMLNRRRKRISEVLKQRFTTAATSTYNYPVLNKPPSGQSTTVNVVRHFTPLRKRSTI